MKTFTLCIIIFTVAMIKMPGIFGQDLETQYNRDSIIAAAIDIIKETNFCALITVNDKGIPQARTMNPFPIEQDMIVWFGTQRRSRKVQEIKNNPNVSIYYADHQNPKGYVVITGNAEIIDDIEILKSKKQDYWETMIPDWQKSMVLIKVFPQKLSVINYNYGIVNDPVTWCTPFIEF